MNLLEVKKRFSEFVDSFEGRQSVELMMQYVELALSEYNANPHLFLGKYKRRFDSYKTG